MTDDAPFPTKDELYSGIKSVNDESGGLLRIDLVMPSHGPALVAAALFGDPQAAWLLTMIAQTSRRIRKAPKRLPVLCSACPRPIRKLDGVTFGVTLPAVDAPAQGLAFAICPKCSADPV